MDRLIKDTYDEDSQTGWMPPKHNKNHIPLIGGKDDIPSSLKEAILSFILACAERHLRGQGHDHSSMLIHVTRLNSVQECVYKQVDNFLTNVSRRIVRSIDHEAILEQLHALWDQDFFETTKKVSEILDEIDPPILSSWSQIA